MSEIRLSDAIEKLRAELLEAREYGEGKELQFNIDAIEVELEVLAENETSADGKVNWWIFGGGVGAKFKDASKHKLKLSLQAVDKNGQSFRVAGSGERD